MNTMTNKIALITGGNSGIGYATAKELISQGAKVIITGRRKDAIEKAALEIGAIPFLADQANLKDIDALYEEIGNQYGNVDILFINAGITCDNTIIDNTSETNFDNVMNIN